MPPARRYAQRSQDWRYILEDSGAKCLFVSTKEIYRDTFHFAGVHGNVQNVFCFDQNDGQAGSFKDLLRANAGELRTCDGERRGAVVAGENAAEGVEC